MKVYTKTGDKGETSLFGGKRISKSDLRIESYGTIDELNSWVGLIRDQKIDQNLINNLLQIQDRLFTLGSILASDPEKPLGKVPLLTESDVAFLEKKMDKMDAILPKITSFVLPGGHTTVSYCHIARCICRRAERMVIRLSEKSNVSPISIQYLNRLSDYLFVLSRKVSIDNKSIETPWKPII